MAGLLEFYKSIKCKRTQKIKLKKGGGEEGETKKER